jgi:hypothetical protein
MNTSNTDTAPRRGRPSFPVILPAQDRFTVNDLRAVNPTITCRLSLYTKTKKLVKTKLIKRTRQTVPTGGVGKPLAVFEKTEKGKAVSEPITF